MKPTTVIAARFQSIGHPAMTVEIDSAPMLDVAKRLLLWLNEVKMTDKLVIQIGRNVSAFESGRHRRTNQMEDIFASIFGESGDDDSELQGVVTSHHTQEPDESHDRNEVDPNDLPQFPANPDSPSRNDWNHMSPEAQQQWRREQADKLLAAPVEQSDSHQGSQTARNFGKKD